VKGKIGVQHPLKNIDLIEDSNRQKLAQMGIENSDQLLAQAAQPYQRTALAKNPGISGEKLLL
jgi:hypothetical protein